MLPPLRVYKRGSIQVDRARARERERLYYVLCVWHEIDETLTSCLAAALAQTLFGRRRRRRWEQTSLSLSLGGDLSPLSRGVGSLSLLEGVVGSGCVLAAVANGRKGEREGRSQQERVREITVKTRLNRRDDSSAEKGEKEKKWCRPINIRSTPPPPVQFHPSIHPPAQRAKSLKKREKTITDVSGRK